jgi:hypothetical protein
MVDKTINNINDVIEYMNDYIERMKQHNIVQIYEFILYLKKMLQELKITFIRNYICDV